MIHPIFMLVLRRPSLFANHLVNYAELVKGKLSSMGASLAVRAAGAVIAILALLLGLGLTGVAVIVGFQHGSFHWVLVAVPGVAWLLAVVGAVLAMRSAVKEKVDELKDEVDADLTMLRLIKEVRNG